MIINAKNLFSFKFYISAVDILKIIKHRYLNLLNTTNFFIIYLT